MSVNNILPQSEQNKQEIKGILIRYHLRPLRRMRQNFLIDQTVIRKMIKLSHISRDDVVIEIGAGLGSLTESIAQSAKKVIAIEKDKRLFQLLKGKFYKYNNIELIEGDILDIAIDRFRIKKYKVIANLPFNITFKVIKKFLETNNLPESMTFIVQKEVGERLCPESNKNNFWSIFIQLYAQTEIIGRIKNNAFWPKPDVKTVIIKIKPKKATINEEERKKILKLVQIGFKHPRKQLINNLERELKMPKIILQKWLKKSKISLQGRAEILSLNDWKNLEKIIQN